VGTVVSSYTSTHSLLTAPRIVSHKRVPCSRTRARSPSTAVGGEEALGLPSRRRFARVPSAGSRSSRFDMLSFNINMTVLARSAGADGRAGGLSRKSLFRGCSEQTTAARR
jgi:hypothetical protein